MKFKLLVIFLVTMGFSGCKKLDNLTIFNMSYHESFSIPAFNNISGPINLLSPNIETNATYHFSMNETKSKLIEEINLEHMSISIPDSAFTTFSYLESINIHISAEDEKPVKIAWITDIPISVGNQLTLDHSQVDLQNFVKKENVNLIISTMARGIDVNSHTIQMDLVFKVNAQLVGP